mmetsp:Transcript_92738/g.245090  ORF Transcript_92738/g.245090 Transcript_92738/m.245090 type:complete len:207 (+) Transcript_92738:471-1091(+)
MKDKMMLLRLVIGMLPKSFAHWMPSRFSLHSMSSRKFTNCENTRALLEPLFCIICCTSCSSASILVEVLNSAVLMRCRMERDGGFLARVASGGSCISAPAASSSSASSRLSVRGAKQVGQPMPPVGSVGACSRYSLTHSRWKAWPQLATTSSERSDTSSWHSAHTCASPRLFEGIRPFSCLKEPCTIRYGWSRACRSLMIRSNTCA